MFALEAFWCFYIGEDFVSYNQGKSVRLIRVNQSGYQNQLRGGLHNHDTHTSSSSMVDADKSQQVNDILRVEDITLCLPLLSLHREKSGERNE